MFAKCKRCRCGYMLEEGRRVDDAGTTYILYACSMCDAIVTVRERYGDAPTRITNRARLVGVMGQ